MDRYRIISQLGDGSFGVVSKAQNSATGEIVAVKKMKQSFNTWDECLQLREIQSLRKVLHLNVVKLKEVVRENKKLFLIFEYCEKNMFDIMRERAEQMKGGRAFNVREVRSIMCQTLLGLQAVHKMGFMHRDLKPENLLVRADCVKVADFGLAKEIRSRPPFTEYVSTRWYRSPEIVLHSRNYNSPVDIWAAGVIFAELFLCRPLFPGTSDSDQLFKICSALGTPSPLVWDEGYQLARRLNIRIPTVTLTSLRQLLSDAPTAAVDLIEQMLRFNPADRPSASQCLGHTFFTNGTGESSALYAGISTGHPHNPFAAVAQSGTPIATTVRSPSVYSGVATTSLLSNSRSSLEKYANLFSSSPMPAMSSTKNLSSSSAVVADTSISVNGAGEPTKASAQLGSKPARMTNFLADDDEEFNF